MFQGPGGPLAAAYEGHVRLRIKRSATSSMLRAGLGAATKAAGAGVVGCRVWLNKDCVASRAIPAVPMRIKRENDMSAFFKSVGCSKNMRLRDCTELGQLEQDADHRCRVDRTAAAGRRAEAYLRGGPFRLLVQTVAESVHHSNHANRPSC